MKLQKTNSCTFQTVFLETNSIPSCCNRGSITCHDIRPLVYQVVAAWNLNVKRPFTKMHAFESPLGKEINAHIVFALPTETLIQPTL